MNSSPGPHRAEALIVEVVRHPVGPHLVQRPQGRLDLPGAEAAHRHAEAVGADVGRVVGARHLAEVLDRDALVVQVAARAVEDGQVLDRDGVAVLQAAVGQAARLDLPAAADGGQRVGRGPAALFSR